MSQTAPCGRGVPRWSAAGQPLLSAALIAGLLVSKAWVRVGPPLFASGPSSGLTFAWSPGPVPKPQVFPLSRLPPSEVTVPNWAQLPFATIVLLALSGPLL